MSGDDLGTRRLAAFLALIRSIETYPGLDQWHQYRSLYGHGKYLSDMSRHPDKRVKVGKHSTTSAAGAYQIQFDTYMDARRAGVAIDFSPASQDKIATWRIDKRGATSYFEAGDYRSSFMLLNTEWSSLPGGSGQRISSEDDVKFINGQLSDNK